MTAPTGLTDRLRMTGYAVAYMFLAIPAVVLFCLEVTFIPLTIVTVGVFALQVIIPTMAGFANVHRRMAERVLGEPVVSSYRPVEGSGVLARLNTWKSDPARWKDIVWVFVAMTAGWTLSIVAVTLFLYIFWALVYPLLWWVTPGTFAELYGIIYLDTLGESFITYLAGAVSLLLWWFVTPALVRLKARIDHALLSHRTEMLERRVRSLAESRAETVDSSAAELRRIERDLHDGAQARLVALGMNLGMADELLADDPEAAKQALSEARDSTAEALGDLRSVVRGIHPPILADRGLVGAVQALALDMGIPVLVTVNLTGRPATPVESAAYFAVAECLANVGKHAGAQRAWVEMGHAEGRLSIEVGDDGEGGADLDAGSGLRGVMRRLDAFDGTLNVSSPHGGPTVVRMEVPCELSSPKTTRSFGTG